MESDWSSVSSQGEIEAENLVFHADGRLTYDTSVGKFTVYNLDDIPPFDVIRPPTEPLWFPEAVANLYNVTDVIMQSNLKLTGEHSCANAVGLTTGTIEFSAGDGLLVVFREDKTVKGTIQGPCDYNSDVIEVGPGDNDITLRANTVYDVHGPCGPTTDYQGVYKISAAMVLEKTGALTVPFCLMKDRLVIFKDGRFNRDVPGINGNKLCDECKSRTALLVEKCASVDCYNSGRYRGVLSDKLGEGTGTVQLPNVIARRGGLGSGHNFRKCLSVMRNICREVENPMKQISLKTFVKETDLPVDLVVLVLASCKATYMNLNGDNLSLINCTGVFSGTFQVTEPLVLTWDEVKGTVVPTSSGLYSIANGAHVKVTGREILRCTLGNQEVLDEYNGRKLWA